MRKIFFWLIFISIFLVGLVIANHFYTIAAGGKGVVNAVDCIKSGNTQKRCEETFAQKVNEIVKEAGPILDVKVLHYETQWHGRTTAMLEVEQQDRRMVGDKRRFAVRAHIVNVKPMYLDVYR